MKKPEKKDLDKHFSECKNCRPAGPGGVCEEWGRLCGYNQACDDWQKYHDWYVKTYCVKKEELPDEEEIGRIYCSFCPYNECNEKCDKMRTKIVYTIAKRIGKEE